MPKKRDFFEKNPMSLGDVGLNRRPATVFIRNSTSFFIDHCIIKSKLRSDNDSNK